jgi:hypothetical protein
MVIESTLARSVSASDARLAARLRLGNGLANSNEIPPLAFDAVPFPAAASCHTLSHTHMQAHTQVKRCTQQTGSHETESTTHGAHTTSIPVEAAAAAAPCDLAGGGGGAAGSG